MLVSIRVYKLEFDIIKHYQAGKKHQLESSHHALLQFLCYVATFTLKFSNNIEFSF